MIMNHNPEGGSTASKTLVFNYLIQNHDFNTRALQPDSLKVTTIQETNIQIIQVVINRRYMH